MVGLAWLGSNATRNGRIRLGVTGDVASSASATLPAAGAPQLHTVVWTPTTTPTGGALYLVAETTNAGSTTLYVSDPAVFEARGAFVNNAAGTGTSIVLEDYPGDWPTTAPFHILNNQEVALVTAVDVATATLTAQRAYSTTAVDSLSVGDEVFLLPDSWEDDVPNGGGPAHGVTRKYSGNNAVLPRWNGLILEPTRTDMYEVWLTYKASTANPTLITNGYTYGEYGEGGVTADATASGTAFEMIRCGTLPAPRRAGVGSTFMVDDTANPGTVTMGHSVVVPADQRVYAAVAHDGINPPYYLPDDLVIEEDGLIKDWGAARGALIEIHPGRPEFVVHMRDVNDDTDAGGFHASIRPRFRVI
jgi:hypothetical protein